MLLNTVCVEYCAHILLPGCPLCLTLPSDQSFYLYLQDAWCVCRFGSCVLDGGFPIPGDPECSNFTDCECRWTKVTKPSQVPLHLLHHCPHCPAWLTLNQYFAFRDSPSTCFCRGWPARWGSRQWHQPHRQRCHNKTSKQFYMRPVCCCAIVSRLYICQLYPLHKRQYFAIFIMTSVHIVLIAILPPPIWSRWTRCDTSAWECHTSEDCRVLDKCADKECGCHSKNLLQNKLFC